MRSKIAERILLETPNEIREYVRLCSDITVRITEILSKRGLTQKELAIKMDKSPSEINKWLTGKHNFTLRSIVKLETELGEKILFVPKSNSFVTTNTVTNRFSVSISTPIDKAIKFKDVEKLRTITQTLSNAS
jgi:transcriptional regulator with XRE-family HTH domain